MSAHVDVSSEYLGLLERAKSVASEVKAETRFNVPQMECTAARLKTTITNFKAISDAMNRDVKHVFKAFVKALATRGSIHEGQAILKGKFSRNQLEEVLKGYIEEYVKCPVCKRPDTRIVKEEDFFFIVCDACGAKSSARKV